MPMHSGTKTVAAAGTREALSATRISASWVIIQALSTNGGVVYVGDNTVSATRGNELATPVGAAAGDRITFPFAGAPGFYDLSLIYIDVAANGNGVKFNYGA